MRIVLDTNVLISALFKRESTSAQILSLWKSGEVELLISPDILAELDRVLRYPKVQSRLVYTPAEVERFVELLTTEATILSPDAVSILVEADPDDDKFVALALAGRANYLISGDNHLLAISTHASIPIVTPRIFLDMWNAPSGSKQSE